MDFCRESHIGDHTCVGEARTRGPKLSPCPDTQTPTRPAQLSCAGAQSWARRPHRHSTLCPGSLCLDCSGRPALLQAGFPPSPLQPAPISLSRLRTPRTFPDRAQLPLALLRWSWKWALSSTWVGISRTRDRECELAAERILGWLSEAIVLD